MATGYLEYAIFTPYTITETNAVGPTADTTLRDAADLPHPASASSSSDANTIYLDPFDGNDADSGATLALAKKTFAGANAALSVTRTVIHIQIANPSLYGTEAVVTEPASGLVLLSAFLTAIQVHPGQTATITSTSTGPYTQAGNLIVHGVRWTNTPAELWSAGSYDLLLEWCWFQTETSKVLSNAVSGAAFEMTNTALVRTGFLAGSTESVATVQGSTLSAAACIVVAPDDLTQSIALGEAAAGSVTLDLTSITFVRGAKAISLKHASGAVTVTNFHSCIFHGVGEPITYDGAGTAAAVTISNSLINTQAFGVANVVNQANVFNRDPLFLDPGLLDFRLAHRGRLIGTIPYPMNSPAVGIGESGVDAGAYACEYAAGATTSRTLTLPADLGAESVRYKRIRTNYQQFQSIRGYSFAAWDEIRHAVEIALGATYWTGSDFSNDVLDMIASSGLKRFYPLGDDGIFGATVPFTYGSDTEIDLTLPREMRPNQYKGWIMRLTWLDSLSTPFAGHFRILSHTGTTVSFESVRGDILTADSSDTPEAAILYLPVIVNMEDATLVSEYYTEAGESIIFKPWYKESDEDNPAEWHLRELNLIETYERGDE